jgi:potassium-transporting ATPase ATP-binding subunit
MMRANVLASSGRSIEAAGDVDVLLLDKTGTITLGKREARAFIAAPEVREIVLANAAQLASLADETPEGRSIVFLAKERFNIQGRSVEGGEPVAFSARTRMSGINIGPRQIRKGAAEAIMAHVQALGGVFPVEVQAKVEEVARRGSTPLVVSDDKDVLGMIELKDIVKGEMQKRCADFRRIGIKTIMITGDNRLTAAAIAAEAGVDHYLAEATPEDKLRLIWEQQAQGHFVATTGGCTNDAPALAQADVAVAMNRGTQAAKEAGNMVDLDNNPLKLFKVVDVGKQMIMTRNALTTFSVANDIAKYVAIVPAALFVTYPQLGALNIMRLHSPTSAILSAVFFNALIIIALIPLALNGVKYRAKPGDRRLARNLLIYGGSGVIAPFIGIKLIDLVLSPFM